MLTFLKRLFASGSDPGSVIESYWCETVFTLPTKVKTPLGSKVSVVRACVDIYFSNEGGRISIQRVNMARCGSSILGSGVSINVVSDRTGEGWYTSDLCGERYLLEAVQLELSSKQSRLHKIVEAKWRDLNRGPLADSVVHALNSNSTPERLSEVLATAGSGTEIIFTYTKANGDCDTRHVTVESVLGDSIRALDHKDGKVKSFRIDRVTNARRA